MPLFTARCGATKRSAALIAICLSMVAAACASGTAVTLAEPDDLAASDASTTTAPTTAPTTTPTTAAPTTQAPTTAAPTTAPPLPADEQPLPTDAAGVAESLNEAELALRDESISDIDVMAYGRRQQQMYRIISANPDWANEIIEAVDPTVRAAVELNWSARQDLSALVRSGSLSTTLPAWRIREPLPAMELIGYYRLSETNSGIPWEYLAAINLVETRMGRIEGLSTAGAVGPMQFLPSTWRECCEGDAADDRDAIIGAGVYLTLVGGPEEMRAALFGYNRSQRYVDAVDAYAQVIRENELAYRGYHAWQVYFLSEAGLIVMPTGYEERRPVDVYEWLEENPDALVGEP